MKKYFTQLQQLKDSDSNLYDDYNEEEQLHFQISGRGFQFTLLNQEFEPHVAKLFNQAQDFNNNLELRKIISFGQSVHNEFVLQPGTGHRDVQVQQ